MAPLRELVRAREAPLLMGVLNCTPDSFSDGGLYLDERRAVEHAESMLATGAAMVDVGAESTRPRAAPIDAREQIARIGGIIRALSRGGALVSIDTTSADVAASALDDGACLVNSVDPRNARELSRVVRSRGGMLALMHSRGAMSAMPDFSTADQRAYGDVVLDVARELERARDEALDEGLPADDVILDPGLGFHKNAHHSLELCARLDEIVALGHPVLVGPSRKSFLGLVTTPEGKPQPGPNDRIGASIAACLVCARKGAAILRVHDPAAVSQALAFERAAGRAARHDEREAVPHV